VAAGAFCRGNPSCCGWRKGEGASSGGKG